jgi:hypothetical protein
MRLMLVMVGGKETKRMDLGVSKARTNEYIEYFQSLYET